MTECEHQLEPAPRHGENVEICRKCDTAFVNVSFHIHNWERAFQTARHTIFMCFTCGTTKPISIEDDRGTL